MGARRLARLGVIVILGVMASLLVVACGAQTQGAQAPKKVRIGYNKTWTTPFLLIAKNQGNFEKHGVQVEWNEFQAPPQAIEALAAGAVDMAIAPVPNFVTAFDKGVDMRMVMHLSGWSEPTSTYFVRADSDINSVRDLKGKKIGVNNYGGNFDLYLRHILVENGLDPKNDVQILEVPIAAVYQALDSKQIDVGVVPALFVPRAEATLPGKLKPLFTYRDIPGIAQRPQFNQLVLVASNNFLKNNRPAAKEFIAAILDAQNWAQSNVQEAANLWAAEAGIPALAQMSDPFGANTKGKVDVPALELDIQLVNRFGYSQAQPAVSAFLDESLVDEINAGK
jgi:ABC-type nitrate/sulfonate/bicarbonate transport system substrate-binding protein